MVVKTYSFFAIGLVIGLYLIYVYSRTIWNILIISGQKKKHYNVDIAQIRISLFHGFSRSSVSKSPMLHVGCILIPISITKLVFRQSILSYYRPGPVTNCVHFCLITARQRTVRTLSGESFQIATATCAANKPILYTLIYERICNIQCSIFIFMCCSTCSWSQPPSFNRREPTLIA